MLQSFLELSHFFGRVGRNKVHSPSHKKFSVSKWLKTQVLLDHEEMRACLEALSSFEFYNVSSITSRDQLEIAHTTFLKGYENYVVALKEGRIPAIDRPLFSSVATVEPGAIYADEVQPGRWMAKLQKPVVQLQHHRFFASKLDHKVHPMVMSPESIYWGLQFAFPQIFFDGSGGNYTKTSDEEQFPNSGLFAKLLKWLRAFSAPTTFVWDGHKVATPLRLGKESFFWFFFFFLFFVLGFFVFVF